MAGGFTLVEMLIVLALLAILAALSWPAVRGLLGQGELRDAARQVRVALVKARLKAIESGVAQRFRYRPHTGRFEVAPLPTSLDEERTASRARSRRSFSDGEAIEGTLPGKVSFQGPDRETGGPSAAESLGESGRIDDAGWSAPIVFFASGRSSNARIRLAGPEGSFIEVTLRGLTGTTRIGPIARQEDRP
jgi:prepilin-type N-terminal cleavage/methylation domain-containing protein